MATLSREHRRLLESTVADARRIAEEGSRKVLEDQYAVGQRTAWPQMSPEQVLLRNQLRAHGRQLGDRRDPTRETQGLDHLVQACAYEHWHRMLFARLLAGNDLLLDPDHGMAMTLDEVRELAREQDRDWLDLAADLAQRMLLAVFRPDDPVLKVSLPPETRQAMEEKLMALPGEIFRADDSLGWVYQFWQRDEKDRVNAAEVKIGADELPSVTQLFTEDYMVLFLLENTLGAWWTAKRRAGGKGPELPGYTWTYLRLNDDGSPAAGAYEGWPRDAKDLRVLDPCMGSGHFLVFALPILTRMRMEEDGLTLREALAAVLRDNLHGLELDPRCAQIAAFNLALAAWRMAGEHFPLPPLNLACSGLGINASENDWLRLAGEDEPARETLRRLYGLFRQAPTLGSLLDPLREGASLFAAGVERVRPLIEEALAKEQDGGEAHELAVAAQGLLAAFRVLASRFTLVATNVPYLGRGKQDVALADYCAKTYPEAKADLATCFVERALSSCEKDGSVALVTPQNWLFLTSYKKLREHLLKDEQWDFVARLGPRAFETISGEVVNVALLALTHHTPAPRHTFAQWDVDDAGTPVEKSLKLGAAVFSVASQGTVRKTDSIFASDVHGVSLSEFCGCWQGIVTGDDNQFLLYFWEVPLRTSLWEWIQGPPQINVLYTGREMLIRWDSGNGKLHRDSGAHNFPSQAMLGNPGIAFQRMRDLSATLFTGEIFGDHVAPLVPDDLKKLPALWCYCNSSEYRTNVRNLDPALKVSVGAFIRARMDVAHWQKVAAEKFPYGLPKVHSDDPTQWLFSGHPRRSDQPLQVAVARLMGYRWPRQTGSNFPDCPALGPDGLEKHADADGIVCLHALAGEASAADRLRALLADAYGREWSATRLAEFLGSDEPLEAWLRDRFFEEHCRLFHQRPFVWHVWDGRKDGFHALVNYHKLAAPKGEGGKTLQKLIFTYLGDWITRQRSEVAAGTEGADARLAAALHLQGELQKILDGEKPYDLFVRWKSLHEQPMGWEPEIDDGVRINIRPWLTATPYQPSRRDACILRVTPKIGHGKDRGKEPRRPKEAFPWFWGWDERNDDFLGGREFDGVRWNDLHYSLNVKQEARNRNDQSKARRGGGHGTART